MSKYVKNLVVREIAQRLQGVDDALLVNVVGIDANQTVTLRRELREKHIHLLVVKNSMARRATEGTPLAPAFQGADGALAVMWGVGKPNVSGPSPWASKRSDWPLHVRTGTSPRTGSASAAGWST